VSTSVDPRNPTDEGKLSKRQDGNHVYSIVEAQGNDGHPIVEAQGNDGHPIVEGQGSKSKRVTLPSSYRWCFL
jgi:hypothetical protein